jgi:hypothetical protein
MRQKYAYMIYSAEEKQMEEISVVFGDDGY